MKNKKCNKCGECKPLHDFYKRKQSKDGYRGTCKLCINTKQVKKQNADPDIVRGKNLKARFNMSIDCYNKMFLQQSGRCLICNKPETSKDNKGNTKWLCVDHNHKTGEVRGLLCSSCNTGLGLLGDSEDNLISALVYLQERGTYGE